MSVFESLLADLRKQRAEVSRLIERASKADLSYEHNHARLDNLDRELERIEKELREMEGDEGQS